MQALVNLSTQQFSVKINLVQKYNFIFSSKWLPNEISRKLQTTKHDDVLRYRTNEASTFYQYSADMVTKALAVRAKMSFTMQA